MPGGDSAALSELRGAPSSVKLFVFWLFETVHIAANFATARSANRSMPLKTKVLRTAGLGSQSPAGVLHRQTKRLLIEMLAFPTYRTRQALMPSAESAATFALVFLLHAVPNGPRTEAAPVNREVAHLWNPVAAKLHPENLLVVLTQSTKGDDEAAFTHQLIVQTAWRLRRSTGDELSRVQRLWRYMVETKQALMREAISPSGLERRAELPGACVLFTLLMEGQGGAVGKEETAPHPALAQMACAQAVGPGVDDPLLHSEFLQRLKGDVAKSLKKMKKRRDDRLSALRTTPRTEKRRSELSNGRTLLLRCRGDYQASFTSSSSLKQERIREKEARGAVGRLVQGRVLLQDLWGPATAVFTSISPESNWRLDDVEGPDRMRVRLKRFLSRPLAKELGIVAAPADAAPDSEPQGSPGSATGGGPARWFPEEEDDEDELKALIDHHFEPGMVGPDEAEFGITSSRDRLASYPCAQVTPMVRVEGELVLFSKALYFLSNDSPYKDDLERNSCAQDVLSPMSPVAQGSDMKQRKKRMIHRMHLHAVRQRLTAHYSEVSGVFRRKYLLVNNSLEVFTERGLAFLFSFRDEREREKVYSELLAQCSRAKEMSHTAEKLTTWQEKWQRGEITNFQYIMSLNTMAGRSFNDLTQYPVFPHVLADYTSVELDLSDPAAYRDLTRPMGCQTEERRRRAADKYEQTAEMYEMERGDAPRDSRKAFSTTQSGFRMLWGKKVEEQAESVDLYALPPYHHGSHFSNRATVLYYCIRLQPFTDYFCELNDLKLDVPDRSFHSMERAWRLSSAVSSTDVKELTPEFFYLPEFLVNSNSIEFGVKQDKATVDHLELPPWAKGNPRLFVDMQRRALEGEECSRNLHHWIDLTFGFKAAKEAAVESLNCFHPYAYEGAVNIDAIEDPIRRQSTIDIINNFGQMPTQLLTKPHKKRSVELIFHSRDVPFWKTKPPERKLHEAPFAQCQSQADKALTLVKSEQRQGAVLTLQSIRGEGSSKESATTRGIDSVANEHADDDVCTLPASQILLVHASHEPGGELMGGLTEKVVREALNYKSWDNSIKVRLYEMSRPGKDVLTLRQSTRVDPIRSAAASSADATHIALGTESGAIEVYRYGWSGSTAQRKLASPEKPAWDLEGDQGAAFQFNPPSYDAREGPPHHPLPACSLAVEDAEGKVRSLRLLSCLQGHTAAVVSLVVSKEFNVILSGGTDGLLIVWDLLDLTFIRSLSAMQHDPAPSHETWRHVGNAPEPNETMSVVDINPQNGDIVAISAAAGRGNQLNLWNINGVGLARRRLEEQATCIQFSGSLVLVGLYSGKVLLLSAFDLSPVSSPLCPKADCPVTALATNEGQTKLYIAQLSNMRTILTTWSAKTK
eukprot:TRINITY_DN37724_c0_g1_i2.p1 TRINITY_DN37724_c0_g1~~TRINITY_DN37724_c0_g1_i2.p1  ORF type:complete len:1372 (+),score=598.18 TRINITY_DN37724_c0_g1_i2:35-4150(+)